jgi:hypothetical protein
MGQSCYINVQNTSLAVDLKSVTNSAIPAEDGVKNLIEVGQCQVIRRRHQSDHHRVHIAKNRTENQSLEGCC